MNPFTERTRITDPTRFTGRWREVGMVFERLERRRPVMLVGAPGAGKSSLLTHVAQSAGAVLELPDLAALFVDLAVLHDAASCYSLIIRALGARGTDHGALEDGLIAYDGSVLLCFDQADHALAAGWAATLLERLARIARRSVPIDPDNDERVPGTFDLMLVVAAGTDPPTLSEPYAPVRLGALASSEVRLLTEAYLDPTGISFSAAEVRELAALSLGHPAYLQRAAYHLFKAKQDSAYAWRAAYRAEARAQPIIGAPLPDAILDPDATDESEEVTAHGSTRRRRKPTAPAPAFGIAALLAAALPLIAALLALQFSGEWLLALLILVGGYGLGALRK
ncbi:MAG: ATP-binding protein [Oscillochloridaceae bacterium umkhey_bin13]